MVTKPCSASFLRIRSGRLLLHTTAGMRDDNGWVLLAFIEALGKIEDCGDGNVLSVPAEETHFLHRKPPCANPVWAGYKRNSRSGFIPACCRNQWIFCLNQRTRCTFAAFLGLIRGIVKKGDTARRRRRIS